MAKCVFISLYDQSAYGARILSACLKKSGHESHIIFFKGYESGKKVKKTHLYPKEKPWVGIDNFGNNFVYAINKDFTEKEKQILINVLKTINPDLIGLTVNTPLKQRAIIITNFIKRYSPNKIIVWGGFEPTINPKDCLNYCDVVCRGEAEKTIVEVANAISESRPLFGINNLCLNNNSNVILNPLSSLEENLDNLPFQDCDNKNNFFIENNKLYPQPKFLFPTPNLYSTITSRGCMFQCSYCCEFYLKSAYKPQTFLRRRSCENVISELSEVKQKNDINYIIFQDEVFSYDLNWLKKFVPLYKEKIGLPFTAFIYPSHDFKEKVYLLKEAGLSGTCLAVQSGSERICKIYNRPFNKKLFLESAEIIKSLNINFYTDVITFNPLEKEDDLEGTLNFLLDIPQPYDICVNKLYILPGTKLFDEIKNTEIDPKLEPLFNFYARLFIISSYFKSKKLINMIKFLKIFKKMPVLLKPILFISFIIGSFLKDIQRFKKIKQDGRFNIKFIINFIKRKLTPALQ